jgi:poly(3-hydroxybutyrate) depolymerase
MLNWLENTLCVDSSRVYASGMSNGGGFVNLMACSPTLSAKFAALAPVCGAYYNGNAADGSDCSPAYSPIPILEFHGLADQTIPYDGGMHNGIMLPQVMDWITHWSERNGCDDNDQPESELLNNDMVTHYRWGCSHWSTEHFAIKDMDHVWPTKNVTVLDATPIIMHFFSLHTLPTQTIE